MGETLAIVLDGKIVSAPDIREAITEGQGQISGGFRNVAEARQLANLLNSGALPIPLTPAETQTVGATLGQDSIQQSIRAGLAGLGIVLLFMLGYYWLPGLVACLALVSYAALTFALFKGVGVFPPIVLDLPGITGFIVIYDRIRENMARRRRGETFAEISNRSLTESFDRSVNTSVAVACTRGDGRVRRRDAAPV